MKEKSFEDLIPVRNVRTHKRHRREILWQITIPLVVGILLVTSACVLTVLASTGGTAVPLWRDISLVWLIAPVLFLSTIPLVLLAGLAYGVVRLIGAAPGFFWKIQQFFENVSSRSGQISDRLAAPIIRSRAAVSGVRKLWH